MLRRKVGVYSSIGWKAIGVPYRLPVKGAPTRIKYYQQMQYQLTVPQEYENRLN